MKILKKSLAILISTVLCISTVDTSTVVAKGGKKGKGKGGKSGTVRSKPQSALERELSSDSPHIVLKTFEDVEKFIRLMSSRKYTVDIDLCIEDEDLLCFNDIFEKFINIVKTNTNIKKISMRESKNLKVLSLKKDKYRKISRDLLEAILQNTSITDFSLPGFSITTYEGWQSVDFDLYKFDVYKELLERTLINNPLVRELSLSFSYRFFLEPQHCAFIKNLFKKNKSILRVCLKRIAVREFIDSLKDNMSITNLSFDDCRIDDDVVPVLVYFLRNNSSVTTLDLSNNKITSKGKALLDEAIASRPVKCDLILAGNSILDADKEEKLKKKIAESRTIDFKDNTGDDDQFMSIIMEAIEQKIVDTVIIGGVDENFQLKSDFMSRIATENLDVKNIACSCFEYLDNICEIMKLNNHVQKIDFSNSSIWDDDALSIAEALRHNSTLKSLNLSNNGICDKGSRILCDLLKDNTTLIELNLSNNDCSNADYYAEKISDTTYRTIRKRLRLNKLRGDVGTISATSDDEFSTYVDIIDRLCENIKRLKSKTIDDDSLFEKIKVDVNAFKGVFDKLDLRSKKYFESYKYYEVAMKSLADMYRTKSTNKKYIEKIYTDILKEFNEFYSEYTTFLNDVKLIKVGVYDVIRESDDAVLTCNFLNYFYFFKNIRSFMNHVINDIDDKRLPELFVKGIPESSSDVCFDEKDNAEIAQLKERFVDTWKNDSFCNVFLTYRKYTLDHKEQYNDLFESLDMCSSISQLSYDECMRYLKLIRFYLPIFKEAKEKIFYKKRIRSEMDLDSEFIRDTLKFEKKFEGQTVDLDECYLRDIDLSYNFADRLNAFDDVDTYLTFLRLWKSQEEREDLSFTLRLNMTISVLNVLKDYIEKIKGEYEELSGELEKIQSRIVSSLDSLGHLSERKSSGQDELIDSIDVTSIRMDIRDFLNKYKKIKEKKLKEDRESLDEKVGASVAVSEEKEAIPRVSGEKSKKQENKQALEEEKVPTKEELLFMVKQNFERLKERLDSQKLFFDMIFEKHAKFLARGYLRVNKVGQAEQFAKKDEISKKIFELRGLFSDLEKFTTSDELDTMQSVLAQLSSVFDDIKSKLDVLNKLLSTAENFMNKKAFTEKETSSSGSESDTDGSDSLSEESGEGIEFVVEYRSRQAAEEYRRYISKDKEKMFFEKFGKYVKGQSSTDLEKMTGTNYPFMSYRYSEAGRICFTYDSDKNCIEIIGVTDKHDYDMIRRRMG